MSIGKFLSLCLFLLLALNACTESTPYPGYTALDDIHYKLISFESEVKTPLNEGEVLDVKFTVTNMEDSLLYNSKFQHFSGKYFVSYVKDSLPISVFNLFVKINIGDSVQLIAPTKTVNHAFFDRSNGIIKYDTVKVNLKWRDSYEPEEYALQLMQIDQLKEDMDIEEQGAIKKYISENEVKVKPISLGYYYIPLEEGDGEYVESGKYVELHYKGYFLDGLIFDSTRTDWPFDLVIGDQDQLIEGLEDGITMMKEGGKAKFIIPSQLAYGTTGSSTGIVPPYTTVMYEVEIVKVK